MKMRKGMAWRALPEMHRTANAQGAQVGREKKQTKDNAETPRPSRGRRHTRKNAEKNRQSFFDRSVGDRLQHGNFVPVGQGLQLAVAEGRGAGSAAHAP